MTGKTEVDSSYRRLCPEKEESCVLPAVQLIFDTVFILYL